MTHLFHYGKDIIYLLFLLIFIHTLLSLKKKSIVSNQTLKPFSKKNWLMIIIFIIVIELLFIFFLDRPITLHCVLAHCEKFGLTYSALFETAPMLLLVVILYLISFFKDTQSEFHKISKIAAINFVVVLIIGGIIKVILMRERPFVSINPQSFFHYHEMLSHHVDFFMSMPSGHVLRISAILMPFIFYFRNIITRAIFPLIILFAMCCRVMSFEHWTSDVILSVFITFSVTYFVMDTLIQTRSKRSRY